MTEILAVDIGGTSSRFAIFTADKTIPVQVSDIFTFPTQGNGISSFLEFIDYYHHNKPVSLPCFVDVDTIVLAAPGPVSGHQCHLPNIAWDIDLDNVPFRHIVMLNDFTAQACACLLPEVTEQLQQIKAGKMDSPVRVAVIGAGTGLGHSFLLKYNDTYIPVPSETGYTTFAFHGHQEKDLERFMLSRTCLPYIVNDVVVSGSGLTLLHEFLTGQDLSAEGVFSVNNADTLAMFSRFYARVCRNYCLTNMIDRLIISGGIAIKHPEVVTSEIFLNEFLNTASPAYDEMLVNLPVFLSNNENIGLTGAAHYALIKT